MKCLVVPVDVGRRRVRGRHGNIGVSGWPSVSVAYVSAVKGATRPKTRNGAIRQPLILGIVIGDIGARVHARRRRSRRSDRVAGFLARQPSEVWGCSSSRSASSVHVRCIFIRSAWVGRSIRRAAPTASAMHGV